MNLAAPLGRRRHEAPPLRHRRRGARRTRPRGRGAARSLLIGALAVSACDDGDTAVPPPTLPSPFTVERRVTLEENDTVLNVYPYVEITETGDILIADGREARVRLYDPGGGLVWQLGQRGQGPEEFAAPMAAHMMDDGALLVADGQRGLTRWDIESARVEDRWDAGTAFTFGAEPLDDTTVLVAGFWMGSGSPVLLHQLDLVDGDVTERFFPLPVQEEGLRGSAATMGGVALDVRPDEIAAAFSLVDTLYVFSTAEKELVRKVPLPIPGFPRELDPELRDAPRSEWGTQFRLIRDVHRLPSGHVLVQYVAPEDTGERHGLAVVDEDGELVEHWSSTPRLLAVDWPRLYFQDPARLAPNSLLIATMPEW